MKKVRNKVFETNSSSTHSIALGEGYTIDTPKHIQPSWESEFGWQFDTWSLPSEKLAYMLRCLICCDYWVYEDGTPIDLRDDNALEQRLHETMRPIQERFHNLGIDFDLPTLQDLDRGYVDHTEWYREDMQAIYNDDEELVNFILNPNSYIEGGNDNC